VIPTENVFGIVGDLVKTIRIHIGNFGFLDNEALRLATLLKKSGMNKTLSAITEP
jgi:hypothetical protein